jgi:hypothetical protein
MSDYCLLWMRVVLRHDSAVPTARKRKKNTANGAKGVAWRARAWGFARAQR